MTLVNSEDSLARQNEKLLKISQSLMRRVEQKSDHSGLAYQQFERAALLETQVRVRTRELERALDLLTEANGRLEEANRETETARANLTEAIEAVNEGFALFDSEGRLSQFNSRFCRGIDDIVGSLREGLPFEDYVHLISRSFYLALPPDQSPQDWAAHRLSLHARDHVVFNVRFLSNRWLQVSEYRTAGGGTVVLQTDVTEIMRQERQERDKMRDAQARMLQATLDHLDQGVCIFDGDARLVGWNKNMDGLLALPGRRTLSGATLFEIIRALQSELEFHDGFDVDKLTRWSRLRRKPAIAFAFTRSDDTRLRVFAQEMPDRGFVVSFSDVTAEHQAATAMAQMNQTLEQGVRDRTAKLKEALADAERANASKSRFMAAASHDLLQPLSAAKLFVSSLTDRMPDAAAAGILERTQSALVGVEKIIEALLDISRLDAGQDIFRVQPVRLAPILRALRDELAPFADAKGLALETDCADIAVRSDPSYLRRILQNLIGNAVRYTRAGSVTVTVEAGPASALIRVADTGPGIAESERARIFGEFERGADDAASPGLGLGLAIVERAAKGLGHPLTLDTAVGVGSTFRLEVPVVAASETGPRDAAPGPEKWDAILHGKVVLLVENDRDLAVALCLVVEAHGADVLVCHDIAEACGLLEEIDLVPDCLLLDYQLDNGETGLDLLETLRACHGAVPAVVVSADRSEEVIARCQAARVPLFSKPVDELRLMKTMAKLVAAADG